MSRGRRNYYRGGKGRKGGGQQPKDNAEEQNQDQASNGAELSSPDAEASNMNDEELDTPQSSVPGPDLPKLEENGPQLIAQTTTHFLPKFDNQNADKRLGWLLHGAEAKEETKSADIDGASGILCVSKKHSGSLVMAPPFYSKNGTGNIFSRVGCVVLYEYFQTVWPNEGTAKFQEWWEDAEKRGICYSFECVTPRVLGDHGATPRCAYMVLTCAAVTREERFMSPSELLQIATQWRLPLNEVWLIPGNKAHEVEKELHKHRWDMQDRDASAILDKHLAPGQEPQCFLSHAETQGQVLEGFVMMALQANPERLSALVKTYNDTMRPFHDAALASAVKLGEICLNSSTGKDFRRDVENLNIAPLNMPEVYTEPTRINKNTPDSAVWDYVCKGTSPGRTHKTLERLQNLYAHSTRLQPYMYKGHLQVQVHVRDDEVFYGWPLHMMDESTGPLFRGMVVSLFTKEDIAAQATQAAAFEAPTPVKILGIAKLKCLNYMWRTFGVRNRLFILLKRGKDDFLKTLKKGFYPPWSIPKEHRDTLDGFFSKWADFVLSLSNRQQDALRTSYLLKLEEFLSATPYPLGTPCAEVGEFAKSESEIVTKKGTSENATQDSSQLSILVLNLSGLSLSASKLGALGLDASSNKVLRDATSGRLGFYEVTTRFPKEDQVQAANAVLVVGPNNNDAEAQAKLTENQRKAAEGSFRGFTKKHMPRLGAKTSTPIIMDPPDVQTWLEAMSVAEKAKPSQLSTSGSIAVAPQSKEGLPKRLILCTLGLPPGGGKSSLFEAFHNTLDGSAEVSFCYRSSDDFKSRASFESEFNSCMQGKTNKKDSLKGVPNPRAKIGVVGYDKNIPAMDGLRRLATLLQPHTARYDVRVLAIVPERLDHDAFWNRVQARDAKTHIGLAIGEKLSQKEAYKIFRSFFFEQCEDFLPVALHAPGAVVSDIFVRKLEKTSGNPLLPLAQEVREDIMDFSAGCSFEEIMEWMDNQEEPSNESAPGQNQAVAPEKGNWCCADVEGHKNLHVTLVPPSDTKGPKDGQRKSALRALQTVAGRTVQIRASKYHRAILTDEKEPSRKRRRDGSMSDHSKRIGFWEVDTVEGLPEGLDLGVQKSILHITDRASLTKGVRAKYAGEVMRQIKKQRGELSASEAAIASDLGPWDVETESHPLSLTATITFYR